MDQLLTRSELKTQFQIADFVLKTQQQIYKDFTSSGQEISDLLNESELTSNEINDIVSQALADVMRFDESVLLQLVYQIDIPQKQFLDAMSDDSPVNTLSDLIVRREAFKVYLRSKY